MITFNLLIIGRWDDSLHCLLLFLSFIQRNLYLFFFKLSCFKQTYKEYTKKNVFEKEVESDCLFCSRKREKEMKKEKFKLFLNVVFVRFLFCSYEFFGAFIFYFWGKKKDKQLKRNVFVGHVTVNLN